jgi:hypothetical protein
MLLAQLFYHFSLGVASRPNTNKGTRRGSGAGLEVEAKAGSFMLQDHAGYLPPRIQTDKDVVRAAVVDPVLRYVVTDQGAVLSSYCCFRA